MDMPNLFSWSEFSNYITDSFQRSILFMDLLRQRGDEQVDMSNRPYATVLDFDYKLILSGRSLARPINYYLGRIFSPDGEPSKPDKAPVIVVDPRAGQGPGISGFKAQSEIGEAIREGHPVYFIGFSATPVEGQTFIDVVEGEAEFIKQVAKLHPDSPRPIAIGNCQAGYQTFMAATLTPESVGTIILAGSPMSYWQGVHGKNGMRYAGGLEGGSWLAALSSDLGNGKFDGAHLIANFDTLNPGNFFWSKQYNVYANIDKEPVRYLGFEKWWGNIILLNADEIQYLVDELFIGNKLTSNQLSSNDGRIFDLRNIQAPIVCFTSLGDNISPPQQTLGWILDLYRSVEEIRKRGQTIVYCVDPGVGHLAIFVSANVAIKEDAAFVRTIDLLCSLPPGLYEMLITPNAELDSSSQGNSKNPFIANFVPRTFDDIRSFGRNSVEDDRAFSTVARLSEINLSLYRTFFQPIVRALVTEQTAEMLRTFHPIRRSYTLFTSQNPCMSYFEKMANSIKSNRIAISQSNPYLELQNTLSEQIVNALDRYCMFRDYFREMLFFSIYGSPIIQGLLGTFSKSKWSIEPPALSVAEEASFATSVACVQSKLSKGTQDEALVRTLLYVLRGEKHFDERIGEGLRGLAIEQGHLTMQELKKIIYEQALLLNTDYEKAIKALPKLLRSPTKRKELLEKLTKILLTAGPINKEVGFRINELKKMFSLANEIVPINKRKAK